MRVTRPARVILAEAMVFAATTLAAASVVLPVTDTGAAMCGATGAPTMDPWFRRFETVSRADLLPRGPPKPNPARPRAARCGTEGARPSGAAANTNRRGYSRPVASGSSVNVIANPVRVAPIPKVIAHVPTNIVITTSGVGAVIDQGRDAQRGDVSCEKRKGETNGNAHRCVAGSLQQQRRLDQCRPLLRAHRPNLPHVVCVC